MGTRRQPTSRGSRVGAAVLLLALTLVACGPGTRGEPPSPIEAGGQPGGRLCDALAATFRERAALAVAFETVIAGDLEAAAEQGSTIRDRLVAIQAALPSLDALDPRQPLMGLVVTDVQELVAVADVLDPPGQPGDPVLLLVEGEVALAAVDAALGAPVGGDLVGRHCPTVRYDAVPVTFPPPPDNLELGLPERVAGWRVDARVAVLGSSMADILERRGVDVGGIRAIRVGLTRGSEWANMEVYDDFPEPVARFLPALRDRLLSFPTEGVTSTVAGFDVIRYEDRSDPSLSLSIAQRGDRVIVVQSITPEDLQGILAAMPE